MTTHSSSKDSSQPTLLRHLPNYIMTLFFCYAAIIQLNDPDKILWFALYAASAAACTWSTVAQGPVLYTTTGILVAITTVIFAKHSFDSPKGTFLHLGTEAGREGFGLGAIILWLPISLLASRFKSVTVLALPIALTILASTYVVPRYLAKVAAYGTLENPEYGRGIGMTFQDTSSNVIMHK